MHVFIYFKIDCGPPTQIPDGKYHPLNGTLFGNQATLSCNFLYIPVGGPDFIECLASGEWSASSVTCQPGRLRLPPYFTVQCFTSLNKLWSTVFIETTCISLPYIKIT